MLVPANQGPPEKNGHLNKTERESCVIAFILVLIIFSFFLQIIFITIG